MFQEYNVSNFDSCHVHSLSNVSSDVLEVIVKGQQMKRTITPWVSLSLTTAGNNRDKVHTSTILITRV